MPSHANEDSLLSGSRAVIRTDAAASPGKAPLRGPDATPDQALRDLIRAGGSLADVRKFVFQHPEALGWVDPDADASPLTCAVERGSLELVNELIGLGADARWRTNSGRTAFKVALLERQTLIALHLFNNALICGGHPPIDVDDWKFPVSSAHRLP